MSIRSLVVAIALLAIGVSACVAAGTCPPGKCPPTKQCPGECPKGKELKVWGGLDSKPKVAEAYKPDKVEIGLGSYKLLELRGSAAGYGLAEREVAVYNRLVEALSRGPLTPEMICVGRVRSAPTVYVGPVRLVSVYASDAAAANTTQQALAQAWRDNLAAILPRLTASTGSDTIVPKGVVPGTYEVAVGGTLLFRLRGPDGYRSLSARGVAVEARIVKMLSDGKYKPALARAEAVDGEWIVMFRDVELVTATAEDAAANRATPEILARAWAAKLNGLMGKLKGPTEGNTTD